MLAPDAHPLLPADLIACHECDLLQREPALAPGETARCTRCGALLARNPPDSIDRSLALACTAAVLYVIANLYPLVGLEMQGRRVEVTLAGALHGIAQRSDPGPAAEGNSYAHAPTNQLPKTWFDAIERLAGSAFMRDVLGQPLHQAFVAIKRAEYERLALDVSQAEWQLYGFAV